MPLIKQSTFSNPPFFQFNGNMQTILPALVRRIKLTYTRERLELSDGDFVDLDWVYNQSKNLVIISHGLEGNSERHYTKGMASFFAQKKWDVLAWNCRSCSGEMNRKMRMYNHGEIGDIGEVIEHAIDKGSYDNVALIGFSMGGNIVMKYLGVNAGKHPKQIKKAVAFSAPCDLFSSVELLNHPSSSFYRKRFLRMLKPKIKHKAAQFPGVIDFNNYKKIKQWEDFDNFFTAPLNGYKDAADFYYNGSAINFMADISIPTLLVNAINDPILTPACFPKELCASHPYISLEIPEQGGHVGFSVKGKAFAWSEYRAYEFICRANASK